jgi:hypothetical protein
MQENVFHKVSSMLKMTKFECILPYSKIDYKNLRIRKSKLSVLFHHIIFLIYYFVFLYYFQNTVTIYLKGKSEFDKFKDRKYEAQIVMYFLESLTGSAIFIFSLKSCEIFEKILRVFYKIDKILQFNDSKRNNNILVFFAIFYKICLFLLVYQIRPADTFVLKCLSVLISVISMSFEQIINFINIQFYKRFKEILKSLNSNQFYGAKNMKKLRNSFTFLSEIQILWNQSIKILLFIVVAKLFVKVLTNLLRFIVMCEELSIDEISKRKWLQLFAFSFLLFDCVTRVVLIFTSCGLITNQVRKY